MGHAAKLGVCHKTTLDTIVIEAIRAIFDSPTVVAASMNDINLFNIVLAGLVNLAIPFGATR